MNEEDLQGARGRNADTGSHTGNLRGGGARVAKSVVSVKSGVVDAEDEDDEEDADQEADLDDNQRTMMLEAQEKDEERSRRLIATFDSDSEERYWKWRALNLDKAVVKRMANQTVSQSIGKTPLLAVHMYAKYFVGEILERAREVQGEYAKAYEKTREIEKKCREEELQRLESKQIGGDMSEHETRLIGRDILRLRKEVNEYIPNPHRGGLLPDHLREALRRYKADGDGGGVGFEGLSHGLLGVQGSAIWRTGDGVAPRRLFR
jgi:transcription initiation factor TFIID subunit 11